MSTLRVTITRKSDGLARTYAEEDDGFALDFQWREGDYACDCNRALFFARAGGEPDSVDPKCGEGAYHVTITDDASAIVYQDRSHR